MQEGWVGGRHLCQGLSQEGVAEVSGEGVYGSHGYQHTKHNFSIALQWRDI